ncbi:MAG TPA: methyltransferase domain-containing protein [Dehalococcoidia bacterium]|nr:methyltransferase domain-containing protein [Dehalococcoidia bacterium]
MPDFLRIYARQEYLTPGADRAVEIVADRAKPGENTRLLDMGSGKGEAAATLAAEFACQVFAVETHDPFIHLSAAKFWHFNLRDLVTLLRANGRYVPLRDASMDAAYCIGAPSIIGRDDALRELARVTKPGGWVVCSDIVWRTIPAETLGKEWGWLADAAFVSADDCRAAIEKAGLHVEDVIMHPREDWEDYWNPMLEVADEAKTAQPADIFFADEIEHGIAIEQRAVETYIDYATFVARK